MSSDIDVAAALEVIRRGNQSTAERLSAVIDRLSPIAPDHEITELARLSASIAESGWKSYEILEAFLDICNQVEDVFELTRIGTTAKQLSGYSIEPSKQYFALVDSAIKSAELSRLQPIEEVLLSYQSRYHHASALLADFIRAATDQISSSDLHEWLQIASLLLDSPRDQIQVFLNTSKRNPMVNWPFVLQIADKSKSAASDFLQHYDLYDSLPGGLKTASAEYLRQFPGDSIVESLKALNGISHLPLADVRHLLVLSRRAPEADTALLLLQQAEGLPLANHGLVERWFDEGLREAGDSIAARQAWVSVESSRSVQLLESLQGQVRFEDHKRVLDLIAEAVSGTRMVVAASEESAHYRSDRAASDGREISLPEVVSLFDNRVDNFGFYKVSLFHQLGYLIFGCFEQLADLRQQLMSFDDTRLAQALFSIVEAGRIDWQLESRYPGITVQMQRQKQMAWQVRPQAGGSPVQQIMEAMVGIGLDADYEPRIDNELIPDAQTVESFIKPLKLAGATVEDSLHATRRCYQLLGSITESELQQRFEPGPSLFEELPEPVAFRGEMDIATVATTLKIEALVNELEDAVQTDQDMLSLGMVDPDQIELGDLVPGEVGEGVSITIDELARELDIDLSEALDEAGNSAQELLELIGGFATSSSDATTHRYDEWDHAINDYRSRWCTLLEHRTMDVDDDYFRETLTEHQDLASRIRQHLNRVRPEMLRKVRGFYEGEELDLEQSVSFLVDRKAGLTPDEKIYVQRQRKDRDVSTLFLLDMSASTDDIIPDPENEPVIDTENEDEDYLMEYFAQRKAYEDAASRIIDLEKESVILMSEALEKLGDAYSVCGFSGYGREQVDYYLCKDFDDPLDLATRGRIGGIKPCRSTRMGAPIRHATKRLLETGSRIKALIMISDGYPQDHDYGADRNSKDYGLMDTMKALSEAKQQGVVTYCLTVDPSGHDYLREMCPDNQYMVIQDIQQLPEELSRVYRSLTG